MLSENVGEKKTLLILVCIKSPLQACCSCTLSHLLEAGKSCYCLPGIAMFGFHEELNIYKITDNCLQNLSLMQNTNL